ncbi:MAG: hypothetical protein A3C02_04740 [Candidatus Andersenbacteria bacterium RIFCSPHIGHO2_02_FULL_45_11]|uniref:Polysaccharide chain length determinant N-terminal domain-containing protein n=1 Tax=Candidatus Andersenbacteria bacterium RIFCSPHIGHO2_12_FULL_45_11 TaxID=1797281 RepID=A0A1G1X287_9BACT|nr:MAG: hypothetical protein A2805_00330 [Candidatus Andersenbacteria bacterium RIFCSPHIGHO2_01_FULL_46_36]OGY34119.1 MAG: hypothetical protein A3D99_01850 [Candidatus Andersenbacteria bacterium RIFCSPHIGHO2_12_FULL_45_11]OGY34244.1 MAG: hypothetical protein A3C02_04740 [Candidatus Andersenbacteria bacterium RIFCSPHIGHO2_02_FULL_45_11]
MRDDVFEILSSTTPRILVASFILALIAYGMALKIPVSYDVHLSYVVSQQEREASPQFRYDGYYALSATDLFTATLAAWVAEPHIIAQAYKAADIQIPTYDAINLTKHVRSVKAAPGLVNITVSDSSRQAAEAVAKGITQIIPPFIEEQNTAGTPAVSFRSTLSGPWTGMSRVAPFPITLVVFVFALVSQILWILFFR